MDIVFRDTPDISIILPIHNGEPWINECFESICNQTAINNLRLEISIYDDASTDKTLELLELWLERFTNASNNFSMKISKNETGNPKGVGFAKNQAVKQSSGKYLCFQDVDDVMATNRVKYQYEAAQTHPNAIIGCHFSRLPEDSTARFTRWANSLSKEQLFSQIYTSNGPTLIMPTWFCSRQVYLQVGSFSETGKGTPEDLLFFYEHIDKEGDLYRVPECLLTYRYHPNATTFTIDKETIWNIRLKRLQDRVLSQWPNFVIWNAGKHGRHLYRSLEPSFRDKVTSFCDVDIKKIGKLYVPYDKLNTCKRQIPIYHFTQVKPPIVICVKLDLTGGGFESNLKSLNLCEGSDYIHFG